MRCRLVELVSVCRRGLGILGDVLAKLGGCFGDVLADGTYALIVFPDSILGINPGTPVAFGF